MIWDGVRGMSEQVERFRRSIGRGRLASAYLFAGPDGVGKRLFARRLAQCLFCSRVPDARVEACGECSDCRQMMGESHPDYLEVRCLEGKRELVIEQFVGSAEKRGREGLCYELSMRPMSATRKVAVIDDATLMNEASANALLKTLEEPPPYALMILIATGLDGLLPTIRSRCQLVRFPPLSEEDVASLLVSQELTADPAEAQAVAALSDGSLAAATRLLDPSLRALRDRLYTGLSAEPFQSTQLSKDALAAIEEIGGDSQTQRRNAALLFRFTIEFYRAALRMLSSPASRGAMAESMPHAARLAARLNPASATQAESLMRTIERLGQAFDHLDQMTPVPLCVEATFHEVGLLLRQR